jgi:hypothetical protein
MRILTVDQAAEKLVSLKGAAFRACVRTPSPISVPEGRLKIGRDVILNNLQPSLRDSIMFHDLPRTSVLGYFQPSLRD